MLFDARHCRTMYSVDGPAWRFKLADQLVQREDAPDELLIDPYIRAYWDVLADPHDPKGDPKLQQDVSQAIALRQDRITKIKIEARMASGQDDAEIAHRIYTSRDVITAYRRLFMECYGEAYTSTILGCHCTESVDGVRDSLQAVVLLYAFRIGPVVVEQLLEYVDQIGQQHDLSTTEGRTIEKLELSVISDQLKHENYHEFHDFFLEQLCRAIDPEPMPSSLGEILSNLIESACTKTLDEEAPVAGTVGPSAETDQQRQWRQSRGLG